MAIVKTPNYSFELIGFNTDPYHEKEHDNWRIIDSVFSNFITVTDLKGVWQNAIAVTVGQKYVDAELGTMFEVLVAHTTPSTGLFAASRTSVPANWTPFTVQISSKGAYTQNTVYSPNDFVLQGGRYGIVQISYTSDSTAASVILGYDADVTAGSIITLVDVDDLLDTEFTVNGMLARTAAGVYTSRTLLGGTGIDMTNGDGVSGAPSMAIDSTVTTLTGTQILTNKELTAPTITGVVSGTQTSATITTLTSTDVNSTNIDGILGADTARAINATTIDATGDITGSVFTPDGDTSASDTAAFGYTAAEGAIITGQGSGSDVTIKNDADQEVLSVPTGTQNLTAAGDLTIAGDLTVNGDTVTLSVTNQVIADNLIELNNGATSNANDSGVVIERGSTGDNAIVMWDESADEWTVGTTTVTGTGTGNLSITVAPFRAGIITGDTIEATGDTAADDNAAMGYTAGEGLILTGQGSTNDITIKNDADTTVVSIPTGGTQTDFAGDITMLTAQPSGDTSAGDSAAIGYNSVDGLVMTGQGSTYDWVLRNDADADVARVATGTQVLDIPGSLKLASGATITAILDEDAMGSDSATAVATQQSILAKINSSAKAPGIQMAWETTTTDTDQGAGKVWTNNATLSSATILYFDDVEAGGVSINAVIDSLDDPTATNSATVYIQEAGNGSAGVLFQVSGAVTSASTYSKVAVTHLATFGTLVDGDTVGVVFSFSGNNGTGTGDLLAANNLSDVAAAATAFGNIKQAASAAATGVVELATDAEAVTGSDTARATTPANVTARLAAPGPIGGTTPAAASFTTISSSGNITLGDAANINMSVPLLAGADHTFTGLSAQMLAGGAIAAFDLVCIHTTTQEVVEADASAYATARVIGIAPAAISDTATGTVLLQGFIRDDTWTWTAGSTLYLSETAGAMTHTAPSTDGAFVLVVGVALSPDVVYINPSMDVIERA